MLIRQYFQNDNGTRRAYWALVESYRTDAAPQQRVVAWLGKFDEAGRLGVEQAASGTQSDASAKYIDRQPRCLIRRRMRTGREQVTWWRIALILVVASLCNPSSERHLIETMEYRYGKCHRIWVMDRAMVNVYPTDGLGGRVLHP